MVIGTVYPNDRNDLLKDIQHDSYLRHVHLLFDAARRALVFADDVLQTRLLLSDKARSVDRFDHRVLQDAHDIMAAAYRHAHDDGGQLQLLETEADRALRYDVAWDDWFRRELEILSKSPGFVRSTVQAVVLANTELGYVAERDLGDLLVMHYGMEDWESRNRFVETYRKRDWDTPRCRLT